MTEPATNGVDDSQQLMRPVLEQPTPSADSLALKVVGILVLIAGAFGGGTLLLMDRTQAAIDKHAERPHVGAATKDDIDRLEKKVDAQDEKLDEVLREVRKP